MGTQSANANTCHFQETNSRTVQIILRELSELGEFSRVRGDGIWVFGERVFDVSAAFGPKLRQDDE